MRYHQHQPTKVQPNLDQSNSRLPIRLISPMKFYQGWIQQGKVPPDQVPSVPVNAQSNCPAKVELDDGDVVNGFPASAVGLQAESMPSGLTGSNPEDHDELPSVSPVVSVSDVQLMRPKADGISASISQAGKPIPCVVRADTGMSASNHELRPDEDRLEYRPRDEAIYDDGVPVSSESYNDVQVQGASPPAVQEVLRRRTKGRTSSTPPAKSVYACIRQSDTASFRSNAPKPSVKSKFDMTPGNTPSPSQFDIRHVMPESGYASENVEFSNNPTPVLELKVRMSSRIPSGTVDISNGQFTPRKEFRNSRPASPYASSTNSSTDSQSQRKCVPSVKVTDKKPVCGDSQHCDRPVKSNPNCINKTAE